MAWSTTDLSLLHAYHCYCVSCPSTQPMHCSAALSLPSLSPVPSFRLTGEGRGISAPLNLCFEEFSLMVSCLGCYFVWGRGGCWRCLLYLSSSEVSQQSFRPLQKKLFCTLLSADAQSMDFHMASGDSTDQGHFPGLRSQFVPQISASSPVAVWPWTPKCLQAAA